jgi:hypothetical protein
MVVRDRKGEDFPVDFRFAIHEPKELDYSPYCERQSMSILHKPR